MSNSDTLLNGAYSQLGVPYVFGAATPGKALDCSGLTQYVYSLIGVKLPHLASAQESLTSPTTSPSPGDLVFWGNPADHVAIYVGNGEIIAAPQPGEVVKKQALYGSYRFGKVTGAGTGPVTQAVNAVGDIGAGIKDAIDSALEQLLGTSKVLVYVGLAVTLGLSLVGIGAARGVKRERT